MKFPTDPMAQHNLFIEALCADWRTGDWRNTPKADRVLEISRQMNAEQSLKENQEGGSAANNRPATDK